MPKQAKSEAPVTQRDTLVRAKCRMGYEGTSYRRGDEFVIVKGKPHWRTLGTVEVVGPARAPEPDTLSELNQAETASRKRMAAKKGLPEEAV